MYQPSVCYGYMSPVHVARRAGDFGVVIDGEISIDMRRVKARKDAIVKRSTQGLEKWLTGLDNCTVFEGHARFEGPHRIRVGEHELEAEQIFINVGARAYVPPLTTLGLIASNGIVLFVGPLVECLLAAKRAIMRYQIPCDCQRCVTTYRELQFRDL